MIEAAFQAFSETFSPPLRRILLKSIGLAFLLLIVLGMILQGAITHLVALPYPFEKVIVPVQPYGAGTVGARSRPEGWRQRRALARADSRVSRQSWPLPAPISAISKS